MAHLNQLPWRAPVWHRTVLPLPSTPTAAFIPDRSTTVESSGSDCPPALCPVLRIANFRGTRWPRR
jgi:hypothetical protein